jgi:hypothetical protein
MSLWKKLKQASDERTGVELDPGEVVKLMAQISGMVIQQCHFEDRADDYDSSPEPEET